MYVAQDWQDYEVIDTGGGEKLERWGDVILRRPDPQIIWPIEREDEQWRSVHGHYHRSSSGGGQWDMKKQLPDRWTISYDQLKFHIRPTNFKHTGLFPEQAANWRWMMDKIASAGRPVSVLNLFAYTGEQPSRPPRPELRLCMWMLPRGWFNGPRKMRHCPASPTVLSVILRMMYLNSCNESSVEGTNTMRSLWTLHLMAAVQVEKRGSLNKACTHFSKAA